MNKLEIMSPVLAAPMLTAKAKWNYESMFRWRHWLSAAIFKSF